MVSKQATTLSFSHLRAREYSHPNAMTPSVPAVATASSVRWISTSLAMMTRN